MVTKVLQFQSRSQRYLFFKHFFPLMFSLSIQVFPSFCTVYFGPDFYLWLNPEQGTSLVQEIILQRRGIINQKEVRISFKAGLSFTLSETTGQTHTVGQLVMERLSRCLQRYLFRHCIVNRRLKPCFKKKTCSDKQAQTWI